MEVPSPIGNQKDVGFGIKVLSLFDGVSCARLALEKVGYKDMTYFASEIDEYATKVTHYNRPDTIHLGSVTDVCLGIQGHNGDGVPKRVSDIYLMIGGSPCQDLSVAKRDRKGLEGDKSSLFYEYVRILNEVKPKWFVLENVATMDQTSKDIITKLLGVEPILLDAGLFSAQDRRRLFWTNIPVTIGSFPNSKLVLKDIMEPVGNDITAQFNAKVEGTLSFKKSRSNLRTPEQKAKTLTASGQNISNSGATNIKMPDGTVRGLTPVECERLQGMPDGWTSAGGAISKTQRNKMCGNAFNVDVVAYILAQIPREPWMDILPSQVNVMKLPPKIVIDDFTIKQFNPPVIIHPVAPEQQKGIPSPFNTEEFLEGFTIAGDDEHGHSNDCIAKNSMILMGEILNAPIHIEAKVSNASVILSLLLRLEIIDQYKADHIMRVIRLNEQKRTI